MTILLLLLIYCKNFLLDPLNEVALYLLYFLPDKNHAVLICHFRSRGVVNKLSLATVPLKLMQLAGALTTTPDPSECLSSNSPHSLLLFSRFIPSAVPLFSDHFLWFFLLPIPTLLTSHVRLWYTPKCPVLVFFRTNCLKLIYVVYRIVLHTSWPLKILPFVTFCPPVQTNC
jgi:hypothetical protein